MSGGILGLVEGLKRAAPKACAGTTRRQLERALSHGLTAIVCVRLDEPTFREPTKSRLTTPEAEAAVIACVAKSFAAFLLTERALQAPCQGRPTVTLTPGGYCTWKRAGNVHRDWS
jgi:DNA gyrase/topoisomerase IV subunit B